MAPSIRPSLYSHEFRERIGANVHNLHYLRFLPSNLKALDVDRVMQSQLLTILPDDYLAKVDSATMGVSVEARSPFLDIDLMELAMRIPADARFRGARPKSLLRRLALRSSVPAQCIQRRKQGFLAPIGQWLRKDWNDLINDFVLGPQVEQRGWFQREALERVVREHRSGVDHAYLLWALLVLELWIRLTLEKRVESGERSLGLGVVSNQGRRRIVQEVRTV